LSPSNGWLVITRRGLFTLVPSLFPLVRTG